MSLLLEHWVSLLADILSFSFMLLTTTTAEVLGWAARLWAHTCPYNSDAFTMQICTLIIGMLLIYHLGYLFFLSPPFLIYISSITALLDLKAYYTEVLTAFGSSDIFHSWHLCDSRSIDSVVRQIFEYNRWKDLLVGFLHLRCHLSGCTSCWWCFGISSLDVNSTRRHYSWNQHNGRRYHLSTGVGNYIYSLVLRFHPSCSAQRDFKATEDSHNRNCLLDHCHLRSKHLSNNWVTAGLVRLLDYAWVLFHHPWWCHDGTGGRSLQYMQSGLASW